MAAIAVAARLMAEHLESSERALLKLLEFIGKVDHER
jgi:hypothetical protein